MISYLLPTRNRPDRLRATLARFAELPADAHAAQGGAEVVVVDDASDEPVVLPVGAAGALPVHIVRCTQSVGAAARNAGADAACGEWLVMLDDDSHPVDGGFAEAIADAPVEVAAIGAEIHLPDGRREAGGLPEVIVGCGAAIRRDAFLAIGGYDPSFHYYAEEYDLCAKLLHEGWCVVHDWRAQVRHEKVAAGRDMDVILARLVRNNGWVVQRYAPEAGRVAALEEVVTRYGRIARIEGAERGFRRGMEELKGSIDRQERRPLPPASWERFTGAHEARTTLRAEDRLRGARAAVTDEGKHACIVRRLLGEMGAFLVAEPRHADITVIGTLSPGPMMDAWDRHRRRGEDDRHAGPEVIRPWTPLHAATETRAEPEKPVRAPVPVAANRQAKRRVA